MFNSNDYQNAFRALESLNEDTLNLSRANTEEVNDFLADSEDDDIVTVYDMDAETDADLEDDNVGKIVLQCPSCNTVILKRADEIEIPEDCETEDRCVQIDDCCPTCFSEEGYKIIGKVAPYEEVTVEVEPKEEEPEEEEIPEEEEEEVNLEDNEAEEKNEDEEEKSEEDDLEESLNECDKKIPAFIKKKEAIAESVKSDEECEEKCEDGSCCDESCKEETILLDNEQAEDEVKPIEVPEEETVEEAVTFDADDKAIDRMNAIIVEESLTESASDVVVSDIESTLNESLKEGLNDIQLDTDSEHISIHSEKKNDGEEMIAPLDFESAAEIADAQSDSEDAEFLDNVETNEEEPEVEAEVPEEVAEIPAEDGAVEADVDEFDEGEFDKFGESLLKSKYSNIKSYKTESVLESENGLICEGLIEFESGKVGKTQFVLEGETLNSDGTCTMLVENMQINPGQKFARLSGKLNDGKFVVESLEEAKDLSEKEGSISYAIAHSNVWKSCKTADELRAAVEKLFNDNGIDTPKSRTILLNLKKKDLASGLVYIFDSCLKGANQGVI